MNSRIPFVAAVVGALLIGGATTGGTHASWVDSAPLGGSSVKAGSMDFTLPSATPAFGVNFAAGGSTQTTTFVVTDNSAGKNLKQVITATAPVLSGFTVDVYAGLTCGTTASPSASSVEIGPAATAKSATFCVKATSTPGASTGTIHISVNGQQKPAGWSTVTPKTVSITANVAAATKPAAPASFRCTGFQNNNAVNFAWNAVTGAEKYRVYYTGSSTPAPEVSAPATTLTNLNRSTWGLNTGVAYNFVVKAYATVGGESIASNQVSVTFATSGAPTCSPLGTP